MAMTAFCKPLSISISSGSQNDYISFSATKVGSTQTGKFYKSKSYYAKDARMVDAKTGQAWKCVSPGYFLGSSLFPTAEWRKDGFDAVVTPPAPKNLTTPTRGNGHTFTTKWTAFKTDNNTATRPTSLISTWTVITSSSKLYKRDTLGAGASSSSFNLADFTATDGKRYNRHSFYPKTGIKVTSLTYEVYGKNNAQPNPSGKAGKVTYKFSKPQTDEGKDKQERYDTRYIVRLRQRDGKWKELCNENSTSADISKTYDLSDYNQLTYSQYLQIQVKAWARGLAGDSDVVESNYYVAFPALATVTSTTINGKNLESRFVAAIKTNSTKEHFVQQVKLEYLADVTYEKASDIPGSAQWTDSGIVDDAQCTALSTSIQNLIPSAGKYTWFRIKTWARNEDVLFRYTEPQRIKALETPAPTAQDERIKILEQVAINPTYNDGKTVCLLLGWNANGQDDATGTEITWSDSQFAWRSTEDPNKYEFIWSDGQRTHSGVTYQDSATLYVHGLEENTPYYFKARRYKELEDDTVSYSPYSNTFTATPTIVTAAEAVNVSVVADVTIPEGKSYPVSWSYDTDVIQEQWQIQASSGTVIASGTGTNQAYQIAADRLATFAVNGVVTFTLRVMVSGTWVKSAQRTVTIVPVPELTIDVPATLTVQPLTFDMECDQSTSVRLIVTSDGVDGQRPSGIKRQAVGDLIYSVMLEPEWGLENEVYSVTVELPSGLEFLNNGNYTVEATPVNIYGIEGETQTAELNIDWSHVAGEPNCEVEPINQEEENGSHTQAITLTLSAPANAAEGDIYDIYRLTGDGATLIGSGLAQDDVCIDHHAPYDIYGSFVRVATRTVDGDTNYRDFAYQLEGQSIRFDWEDQSLELPYNLTIQDAYTKDVEFRKHMDGTQDAYWNSTISRGANYTSTVVDLTESGKTDQVRALARYTGAVFVRTPDGSAFTADVQVTDLTPDGGLLTTVSITATEIDLVESFMLEKVEE